MSVIMDKDTVRGFSPKPKIVGIIGKPEATRGCHPQVNNPIDDSWPTLGMLPQGKYSPIHLITHPLDRLTSLSLFEVLHHHRLPATAVWGSVKNTWSCYLMTAENLLLQDKGDQKMLSLYLYFWHPNDSFDTLRMKKINLIKLSFICCAITE